MEQQRGLQEVPEGAETAGKPKGNAASWSRTKCAQALTLRIDSLDNYLCKTKKPRDKQGQSRDSDIGKVRTEPGEMELLRTYLEREKG